MRFLRRGGKGTLPVAVESADESAAPEAPSRPAWPEADDADAADDRAAEPTAADAAADTMPAEPADADVDDVPPDAAEAGQADDDMLAAGSVADEETPAAAAGSVAPDGPDAAATIPGPAAAADEPRPRPSSRARRKRASSPEAEPITIDPELPPTGDEDLAALVIGGGHRVESEPASPAAPAHPFAPTLVIDDAAWPDPLADGRPVALRLAGLHLRVGQHALARAELESLAGRGRLDEPALLDLAEVRWRTGDLSGAGDAANALLARGTEAPLALVIAAEAVAAAGRPSEARRLSSRAIEVADEPLDLAFAGMPRALIWPVAAAPEPSQATPRRRGRRATREVDGAPSTAAEAFAGGRAALAKGDASRAALLLGVAMRLEPGFAEDVLRAVAGRDDQPLLALVRGDALRLLGREAEALEAFDRARGRSSASATASPEPAGPGLFDDDPG